MVPDNEDHGPAGIDIDDLTIMVVGSGLMDALAFPFDGDAAAFRKYVGITAVGDGVEVDIAMVASVLELGFLDDDIGE